jgi:hypothetical protein
VRKYLRDAGFCCERLPALPYPVRRENRDRPSSWADASDKTPMMGVSATDATQGAPGPDAGREVRTPGRARVPGGAGNKNAMSGHHRNEVKICEGFARVVTFHLQAARGGRQGQHVPPVRCGRPLVRPDATPRRGRYRSNTAARLSQSAVQLNAFAFGQAARQPRVVAALPTPHPLTAQRTFLELEASLRSLGAHVHACSIHGPLTPKPPAYGASFRSRSRTRSNPRAIGACATASGRRLGRSNR